MSCVKRFVWLGAIAIASIGCSLAASSLWATEGQGVAEDVKPPIALRSDAGRQMLLESQANKFIDLSMYFVTQDNIAYCGVASSTMVLNASGVDRPISSAHGTYRLWTQENFWTLAAQKAADRESVRRQGMTLSTLGDLLTANGLDTELVYADKVSMDAFREKIVASLKDRSCYLLVNYYRAAIGQAGGGHISPIAAYHLGSDSVLVLDVARYRYEPVWVDIQTMWKAVSAIDPDSGHSRGLVIGKKSRSQK